MYVSNKWGYDDFHQKKKFCSHYNQQQILSELLWAIGKDPGMTGPFWSVF